MKKQTPDRTVTRPIMEVYDAAWRLIGDVPDRGTKVSLELARARYGEAAVHVLPAIVEVAR